MQNLAGIPSKEKSSKSAKSAKSRKEMHPFLFLRWTGEQNVAVHKKHL